MGQCPHKSPSPCNTYSHSCVIIQIEVLICHKNARTRARTHMRTHTHTLSLLAVHRVRWWRLLQGWGWKGGGFSHVAAGAISCGRGVRSLSRTLFRRWSRGNQIPGGYQPPTGFSWCISRIVGLGWFGVFERLQWHRWTARLTCRVPEIRAAWGECSLALGGPWCSP